MKAIQETVVNLTETPIEQIIKEVQDRGYYIARTPQERRGQVFKGDLKRWKGKFYRFGVVSDTHLGSAFQQLTHLNTFYSICAQRRIAVILHCGDLSAGENVYKGQIFENFVHGADAQTEYIVKSYPKKSAIKTYAISGNHDFSFMKNGGYNLVRAVGNNRSDIVYLGDDIAYFEMGNIKVMLVHPTGGGAYATSYKSQKLAERIPGGEKPHMLFMGHYHHPNIIPGYRNIEVVQMPCFQAQTPFEKTKGLYPFIGGFIITVQEDESGLAKVIYELIPFYKPVKDDF